MRLELGSQVRCTDEVFGELADVVIDPIGRRVTHLVVQPHDRPRLGRLVPIELAESGDTTDISLRCTTDEVRRLPLVQEFAYLQLGEFPVDDPDWDVGVERVLAQPNYDASGLEFPAMEDDTHVAMTYDRIPKGKVEIQRASAVGSAEGHNLGHVDGFLVEDGQITHIVLERGHLWGRREITIPIGAVASVATDSVTLSLSKDEVEALPAVHVRRRPGR